MAQVGRKRYIAFRIADVDGNPVTGLALNNFERRFLRDGEACADVLAIQDEGGGLYCLTYTPSDIGIDYVELYHRDYDLRIGDEEEIGAADGSGGAGGSNLVYLTQNTGGSGALSGAGVVARPQEFTLYVFKSTDWQAGDHNPLSAIASTPLASDGTWMVSPLVVVRGVYHIVLLNNLGETHLIRPFLDLSNPLADPSPAVLFSLGIRKEIPTGACDGVNTVFTLVGTPLVDTEEVHLNGMLLSAGADEDYLLVDNVIQMNYPPDPGSKMRVTYGHKTVQGAPTGAGTVDVTVTGETPSGAVDGVNDSFTTVFAYKPSSLRLFLNGVRLTHDVDFSETGANQITLGAAPAAGDRLLVDYLVQP